VLFAEKRSAGAHVRSLTVSDTSFQNSGSDKGVSTHNKQNELVLCSPNKNVKFAR
jgi:hypothetical protein